MNEEVELSTDNLSASSHASNFALERRVQELERQLAIERATRYQLANQH
jgi:hypothetical protein